MNFRLSDDEAIALAAHLGIAWPTPLPTVRTDQPGEVGAALARGVRSLRLRDLLDDVNGEATLAEPLSGFVQGIRSQTVLVVQAVDPRTTSAAGGALLASVLPDGHVFLDLISAVGVHDFELVSSSAAVRDLLTYLERIFSANVSADGSGEDREIWVTSGDARDRIAVRRGAVQIGASQEIREWTVAEAVIKDALSQVLGAS